MEQNPNHPIHQHTPTGIPIEDDTKESVELLVWHRIPWLLVGLAGGVMASFIVSRFEAVISQHIALAFFLPLVVYMSDAVGSQTREIYVRNLASGKVKFGVYLVKEFFVGLSVGVVFGILLGLLSYIWIGSHYISITVGAAMFISMSLAPVLALLTPTILAHEKKDPALGSGPFTTIIQDLISVFIYFAVASIVLL